MKTSVYIGPIDDAEPPDSSRRTLNPDQEDLLTGGEFQGRVIDIDFCVFQSKGKLPVRKWAMVRSADSAAWLSLP